MLFLPLMMALGAWQLMKSQTKGKLQEMWRVQQALPAREISSLDEVSLAKDQPFQRIKLIGRFDLQRYFLFENQVLDGRVGLHVLMVLELSATNELIVVNRGWAASDVEVASHLNGLTGMNSENGVEETITITGHIKAPSGVALIDESENPFNTWPHQLVEINLPVMSEYYGADLGNQIVLIDADNRAALDVFWQPINLSPERHRGYAVQWWLMALALICLWLFANSNVKDMLQSGQSKP